MGLSSELSCQAASFSRSLNPHRFFQSEVWRPYFPTLEPWVAWSVLLFCCSSWFFHMQIWDHPLCQLLPPCPVLQPWPCCESSPTLLPISTPPAGLDECFLFNSLVVGLPYSSISQQFWLFFVFKFAVVLLLVVQRGTVYLPTPPSWLVISSLYINFLKMLRM